MGDWLKALWHRLANDSGEVAVGAAPTLPPEVQEKLDKLAKLEKDNSSMGYRLRAWDKVGKDLGQSIEYDTSGNPIRVVATTDSPPVVTRTTPVAGSETSYPFEGVAEAGAVNGYIQAQVTEVFNKQGFVTQAQLAKIQKDAGQQGYLAARQDALFWRSYDRLVAREVTVERLGTDGKPVNETTRPYAALDQHGSEFSKRVQATLLEKRWGEPMNDKASSFATDYYYSDPMALEWAADLTRMTIANEGAAATVTAGKGAAATATGEAAQAAEGVVAAPAAGTGVSAGAAEKPDFESMKSTGEVLDALDDKMPAESI